MCKECANSLGSILTESSSGYDDSSAKDPGDIETKEGNDVPQYVGKDERQEHENEAEDRRKEVVREEETDEGLAPGKTAVKSLIEENDEQSRQIERLTKSIEFLSKKV